MKVKEYFKELSDVLNAYTFGDLFEAMQAVELCDQFITENEIPEEELAQIRLLKSLLESIILQGRPTSCWRRWAAPSRNRRTAALPACCRK